MDLNNKEKIKKLDSMGIGKALELFPEQIRTSFEQAMNSNISKIKCDSVIISGMGGSSNAAKILESVYEEDFKAPIDIDIYNDYGLPSWVNKDTLVVANSYSGNTEETISAVESAKKIGAKIIGVTTGGKLGEMINSKEFEGSIIDPEKTNPPGFPKAGLGVSFGALAGALTKAGILKISKEEINTSLNELKKIRSNWLPDTEKVQNDTYKLAKWIFGSIPVLFSGRPLIGSLNAGRNVICEIGRTFCLNFDFPEVNHVLVEATQKPEFVKSRMKYIFFDSSYLYTRVKTRYLATQKIFNEQGLKYKNYELVGSTKLIQGLELPHLCAWIAYYLSVLNKQDPGPEPWIIKLKKSLSQPVH